MKEILSQVCENTCKQLIIADLLIFCCFFTVATDVDNKAEWKQCLQVNGIRLPTGYFFGLTAATGDLSDYHDVLAVRLYEIDQPQDVSVTGCTFHKQRRSTLW